MIVVNKRHIVVILFVSFISVYGTGCFSLQCSIPRATTFEGRSHGKTSCGPKYDENRVYAGTRFLVDVFDRAHKEWQDPEMSDSRRFGSIPYLLAPAIDLPFSFIMDTILLPYTVTYTLHHSKSKSGPSADSDLATAFPEADASESDESATKLPPINEHEERMFAVSEYLRIEDIKIPQNLDLEDLAGRYHMGNDVDYNLLLKIHRDGFFKYDWRCVATYGTSEGSWSLAGNSIVFEASKEADQNVGHLGNVYILYYRDRVILVPQVHQPFFSKDRLLKYGPARSTCFVKMQEFKPNGVE